MPSDTANPINGRELLLRIARDVFYEDGYQKATMRKIGQRAGMSQTAIYYHFTDKEDVLFTLIEDFTNRFSSRLVSAVARGRSPREQLANLISAQLDMLVENNRDLKILSQDKSHLSEMRLRLIRSQEKTVLSLYRACLDEWRKAGGLPGIDSTVAAFAIIGAINWLYQWYVPDGPIPWETVKQSMLLQLLQGLDARPGAAQAVLAESQTASLGD
ncbi:MAG: TetR/AcrR family transcriptional regulator [Burkholderiaceae bacterium]|nr:TetR/AcrR family transcriptional regulator [Burkholderiaceae bacterium]